MAFENRFDVVVSGAGPAGCTTALFLARAGKKVLVLEKEKFPRDKICADNKTWKCLDLVNELGLWNEFEQLPKQPIRGVLVASPAGHEMFTPLHPADVREKGSWFNVRRLVFDAFLADACKREKNVVFRENCEVLQPLFEKGQMVGLRFCTEKNSQENVFAKVIVGADGSQSPIAQAVGIPSQVNGRFALNARAYFKNVSGANDRCELYYLKGICPGYFWIFPVDNNTFNVGIGLLKEQIDAQHIDLEKKVLELLQHPLFKDRFQNAKQVLPFGTWGVSVLGRRRPVSGPGFVLVGDAATMALTFSGEGVGPGMRSGKIAARAILKAFERNDFSAKSLREFDKSLWAVLEPEVRGFRWLEFLLRHERVFDWVVKKAARNQELVELSSRMQNDYSLAGKMVNPKNVLNLLV